MITSFYDYLIQQGIEPRHAEWLTLALDIAAVLLLAIIVDRVAKRVIVSGVSSIAARTAGQWDDAVIRRRVLHRLAHVAPAVVIYHFVPTVLAGFPSWSGAIRQASLIFMLFVGVLSIDGALNAVGDIMRPSKLSRDVPLTSFVQVLKVVLYGVAAISGLSLLLGKSPVLMLSGLGAMTAVLMLVFKDPILGFVGGIQLAANQMVARGDWIEMPKYGADGDVLDVGLTSVKVQNFDKTITTIPTYALVSESFKNWRGMSESGGRRIKRAIHVDMSSIRFCDDEMLARFAKIRHMAEYLDGKKADLARWNAEHGDDASQPSNLRRLTNVGTFRAYVVAYLRHHEMIHQGMTLLVRHLELGPNGLPIEIYVFSRDTDWVRYEDLQADIFDHILAIAPEFDLRVYQSPSGGDLKEAAAALAALRSSSSDEG